MNRASVLFVPVIASLALSALAQAKSPFARFPSPGIQHYQYEVVQTINGATRKGYRTQFDLISDGKTITAIIRHTAELAGDHWKTIVPDPQSRSAMHGDARSLAQLQLFPLRKGAAHDLGDSFLAMCAPSAIFFPLTDTLNAVIIPVSDEFKTQELSAVGKSVGFEGFDAAYDRAGEKISEHVPGGQVRLVQVDRRHATVEWQPQTADLVSVDRTPQGLITLRGTEHWAFRVVLDRSSGSIESASTIYDDLDLAVADAPSGTPHVQITRVVTIEHR